MGGVRRVVVTALVFALAGYAIAATFGLANLPSVSIPAFVIFALCPVAVLTITVDPSPTTVLTLLAPLNALVYALVGATVGPFALRGEYVKQMKGRKKTVVNGPAHLNCPYNCLAKIQAATRFA